MEYIGWLGTFLGFFPFALLAFGKIKNTHWFFSSSICCSSLIFLYTSFLINNYQSLFTNLFFVISSALALCGILIKANWISKNILYSFCLLAFLISAFYYLSTNNQEWLIQSLGWIPVFAFPFIFFLYTQNKVTEQNYYILNMSANIIFSVHLIAVHNYPLLALQIFAFGFAIIGLIKILIQSKI